MSRLNDEASVVHVHCIGLSCVEGYDRRVEDVRSVCPRKEFVCRGAQYERYRDAGGLANPLKLHDGVLTFETFGSVLRAVEVVLDIAIFSTLKL